MHSFVRSYLLEGKALGLHLLADEAHVGPRLQGALERDVRRGATHEADKVVVLLGRQRVELHVSDLLAEKRK